MTTIQSVDAAAQRGDAFLAKYFPFKKLLSAKNQGGSWLLTYDVGIFLAQEVHLTIDANTGEVTEYDNPRSA